MDAKFLHKKTDGYTTQIYFQYHAWISQTFWRVSHMEFSYGEGELCV